MANNVIETPEFLEWLEKKWNDAFCQMEVEETITELGWEKAEAITLFEEDTNG